MSSSRRRFCIAVLVIVLAVVLAFTVVACKKSGTTNNPNTGDKNTSGPVSGDYKSEEVSKTEWNKAFAAVYSAKANASNFTAKASSYGEGKGAASGEKVTSDVTLKIAGGKISYNEVYAEGDYSEEYETYYEYVTAESAWYEYSFDEEADGWNKGKSAEYAASSTVDDFGSLAFVLKENGLSDYADYTFNSSKGRYETTVEDKKGATYTAYVKFKDASIAYAYIEFENDDFSGNYEIFWYDYGTTKVTLPTAGEPEAPATYYTVTFDTQGGSAMASVEVKEGAVIGDVTLPTKQCAEFVGFAKDANGKEMWDLNSDTVTGNITLYAIWEDAHTWEAWETVSEPTCTAEGMRKRICDKCGDDETESIPALGHDFEEEYTVDAEPDCETKGSESRHCTRCDATTDSREIEALGHNYTVWAYDDTEHWKVCSRCGGISEKTGHVYQESGKCECGATEITPESEFTFTALGEDTYSLAGYSGTRENIRIPATYNGGTVVSIESSAFANCTGITSVIVPDSVTSIGEGAFAGCSSLESITIPFVGAEAGKTSKDTYQYPLGYIFGTVSYTGGTEVTQYYYGSNTSRTAYSTYYIPSSLRSVTVTGGNILYGAFYNCSTITSVTIPDSVTAIGGYAFYNCTGLTSMPIPDSVTSIGRSALSGCTGLTSVTIPESLTNMQNSAFDNCTGLTSVYYTGDIAGWCGITFGNRSSTPLYYAGKLYIDGQLVTDLVIPDSVTKIKDYAFSGYTGLTSVNTSNSVNIIGDSAFSGCTGLTSVTIGNSVTSIGGTAFSGCTGLTSVTIGNSVTSIGSSAFWNCTGLTSLTIGSSVTNIGDYAFHNCTGLKSVYYTGDIAGWCGISFGDQYANPLYYAGKLYIDGQIVEDLVIPDSVTEIKDYAFDNFVGLTTVTIPGSVKTIGNYAFRNCTGLKAVYYTGDVANWCAIEFYTIDSNPLQYAGNLYIDGQLVADLVIPDSVTEINAYAFYGCTGLTSVTIGNSVTSIGDSAFYDCYKLVEVYNKSSLDITAGNTSYGCVGYYAKNVYTEENGSRFTDTADGYRFFHDGTDVYLVGYYGEETEITLPSSFVAYDDSTVNTYNIGDYAFYGNTSITSLTITDSVVGIGENAFCQTRSLRNLVIEPGIEALPQGFLYGCSSLESITIPFVGAEAGKTSSDTYQYPFGYIFGTSSYTGGTGVRQLYYGNSTSSTTYDYYYIPSSLRSVTVTDGNIPVGAFSGCAMLTSVTIGNSVTSIGDSAFVGCTGLTSVTIGNSVTSIGDSAFVGCTGLTSVTIGNSVTSIGDEAFSGCTGLTSVTIPDSVESIGSEAFYDCTGLTSVTIGTSVTSIGRSAFYGCYKLVEVYNKSSLNITAGDSSYGDVGYYAKNVYTEENGSWLTYTADGYCFFYDGTKGYLVSYYGEATDITLPESFIAYDGTTVNSYEINQYAFYGNTLTSVTIGNSVASIGMHAFYNCTGLTSINYTGDIAAWCGIDGLGNITGSGRTLYIGGQKIEGELIIPDTVTEIKSYAFYGCAGLTSVTIPNSVTSIGDYAFSGCTGLASVTIGNSVTSIGYSAFYNCTGLTSVTIPDSVTNIGDYAFHDCTGLTSVTIGNSVTSIGSYAFSGCTAEIIWGDNPAITVIGEYAFREYGGDSVVIPDSVTSIGWNAFSGYTAKIIWGDNPAITVIGEYAFAGYGGDSIVIPDSVTSIGSYAFRDCTGLTSIEIPESVMSIKYGAFSGCTNLIQKESGVNYVGKWITGCDSSVTEITLRSDTEGIGLDSFSNCTRLTSIYFTGDIEDWCGIKEIGNLMNKSGRKLYIGGQPVEGELIIPDSVTEIKSYAFAYCTGLTSVTIPDSVTSIGNNAFYGCNSLENITTPFVTSFDYIFGNVPNSLYFITLTSGDIPYREFYGYSRIISVIIGSGVKSIGEEAFLNCTGLTSVTISAGVTSIGAKAFSNCNSLTIYCEAVREPDGWNSSWNSGNRPVVWAHNNITADADYDYTVNGDFAYLTQYKGVATDVVIPSSIGGKTVVGFGTVFAGNTSITSVVIPDSVKIIGDYAFVGCTGLISVIIGNSVTSIGSYAFSDCTGLATVAMPENLTIIERYAFSGCTGLTSVTIPDSVTSIGSFTFKDCAAEIAWGENPEITAVEDYAFSGYLGNSIVIPDSVTNIGRSAFDGCRELTSVTIPNSVTTIEDYAFYGCTGLTSVTIPYSVTQIGYLSFTNYGTALNAVYYTGDIAGWCAMVRYGSVLENGRMLYIGGQPVEGDLVIPDSVTSIGSYAFSDCTGLTSVTIPDSVTSIGRAAFKDCTGLTSVTIPNSVTSIGDYAFSYCTGLTSVTIGNSVTSIGDWAFSGCTAEIIWGDNPAITVIGEYAFREYGGDSIVIPDSVTSIGYDAFSDCTGLTSVTIGTSVTSIRNRAFSGCYKLVEVYNKSSLDIKAGSSSYGYVGYYAKNVYTEENGSWLTNTVDGYRFLYDGTKGYLVDYYGEATDITLPESFTAYDGTIVNSYEIYQYAFYGNTALTSVTISDSVTSIGERAFYNCTGLTSVTIPDSVTSIGSSAFSGCTGLTSVTIGNAAISIGDYAFYNCTGLTSVVFEDTDGWQVSWNSDFSSYTSLASADLADASTAATYLKSRYYSYYWRKVAA